MYWLIVILTRLSSKFRSWLVVTWVLREGGQDRAVLHQSAVHRTVPAPARSDFSWPSPLSPVTLGLLTGLLCHQDHTRIYLMQIKRSFSVWSRTKVNTYQTPHWSLPHFHYGYGGKTGESEGLRLKTKRRLCTSGTTTSQHMVIQTTINEEGFHLTSAPPDLDIYLSQLVSKDFNRPGWYGAS